jgi:hypothetical protein
LHFFTGARSQRDHDLAVDAASSLQCDGVTDLLDRKNRGDRHGDLAGEDRIGDPDLTSCVAAELGALAWKIAYERRSDTSNGDDFSEVARRSLGEVQAASALC